jgi:hypothetical protein
MTIFSPATSYLFHTSLSPPCVDSQHSSVALYGGSSRPASSLVISRPRHPSAPPHAHWGFINIISRSYPHAEKHVEGETLVAWHPERLIHVTRRASTAPTPLSTSGSAVQPSPVRLARAGGDIFTALAVQSLSRAIKMSPKRGIRVSGEGGTLSQFIHQPLPCGMGGGSRGGGI